MGLTQITTGGVDDNINIDSNTLKVDGTNNRVGIGTAAPTTPLTVQGDTSANSVRLLGRSSDDRADLHFYENDGSTFIASLSAQSNSLNLFLGSSSGELKITGNQTIFRGETGTERMRIDSSGNVGVGVTPNTHSLGKALEIGAEGNVLWGEGAGNIHLLSNAYYNGGYKYATSAPAGRYNIYQNTHTWARASSGTADAAATFTESMRIDSSGRLLVGTSSTSLTSKLIVRARTNDSNGNGSITLQRGSIPSAVNQSIGAVLFTDSGDNYGAWIVASSEGAWTSGSSHPTRLVFSTTANGASSPTERMRLNNEGKLLIGSDTGSVHDDRLLQVGKTDRSQTYISITNSTSGTGGLLFADTTTNDTGGYRGQIRYDHSSDSMDFRTAATERMRINSVGEVGIGTNPTSLTGYGYILRLKGGSQAYLSFNNNTHSTEVTGGFVIGNDAFQANIIQREDQPMKFYTDDLERVRIEGNGNVVIGSTSTATNTRLFVNSSGLSQSIYSQATGSGSVYAVYGYVSGGNSTQYGVYGQAGTSSTQASGGMLAYSINTNTYGIIGYWNGSAYYSFYGNGVVAGSSFTSVSDSRLKDVDSNLTGCLSKLANIQPVKYTWKENSQQRRSVGEGVEIGMLAQEVQAQFPELVSSVNNGRVNGSNPETLNEQIGTTLHIDYSRMTAVLVQALKEAKERIETLETKVAALEAAE